MVVVNIPDRLTPPPEGWLITVRTDHPEHPLFQIPIVNLTHETRVNPLKTWVGRKPPKFEARTVKNTPIDANSLINRVTLLNFVAHDCSFCAQQIPVISRLEKDFSNDLLQIVTVHQTLAQPLPSETILAALKNLGIGENLVLDPNNQIGRQFQVSGYPTLFLIGPEGRIEAVHTGFEGNGPVVFEQLLREEIQILVEGGTHRDF